MSLFDGLDDHELRDLLDFYQVRTFHHEDIVYQEGDPSRSIFVILAGRVRMHSKQKSFSTVLHEGKMFGEMGIVSHIKRTSSVEVIADNTSLLEIRKTDFNLLLGRYPRISYILMRNIAATLSEIILKYDRKAALSARNQKNDIPQVNSITTLKNTLSGLIVINKSPFDDDHITHFRISHIENGSVFTADHSHRIKENQFVSFEQAQVGLRFLPEEDSLEKGGFHVEAAFSERRLKPGNLIAKAVINVVDRTDKK